MKWILRLLTLITVVSVAELYLLIQLNRVTNIWVTLATILIPGLLGSWLIRREGSSAWGRLRGRLDSGALPSAEVVDGVLVLLAGTLLITPGVITDVTGLIALIPAVRVRIRRSLLRRARQANPDSLLALLLADDEPVHPSTSAPTWQGASRDMPEHARSVPPDVH